jgi:hypothetical protein
MLYATESTPNALTSAGILMNNPPTEQEESQMAYVLEEITPDDVQKIIDDAATNSDLDWQQKLKLARVRNIFPTSWAIDRERGHYLFKAPFILIDEVEAKPFYLFAYGRMYVFRWLALTRFNLFIDEKVLLPPEELLRIQHELILAFQCHGTRGNHPSSMHMESINFVPKPTNLTEV